MFNPALLFDPALAPLVQSSSDSSGGNGFAFIFLLAGFVFYGLMFARYRNVTKRHHHESDTQSRTANVQAGDTFVKSRTGIRESRMSGANNTKVSGSLRSFF